MTLRPALGLVALSLLASAAWFVDDLLPVQGAPLAGEGLRLLLCSGLFFVVLAWRRKGPSPGSLWRYWKVAFVSLGVVAIPSILLDAARGRLASTDGVVIFALTPVATMLIASRLSLAQGGLGALPHALLGVAGIATLLPVRLPTGGAGALGICLLVVAMLLSAASIVWLHLLLQDLQVPAVVSSVCLVNGLAVSIVAAFTGWGSWASTTIWPHGLRAILFDLPQMVLLIWLTKKMLPQRLAARYLVAPLFTVVEGFFLVRPHLDGRTCVGLTLLTLGAGMAIFAGQVGESDTLRLNLP